MTKVQLDVTKNFVKVDSPIKFNFVVNDYEQVFSFPPRAVQLDCRKFLTRKDQPNCPIWRLYIEYDENDLKEGQKVTFDSYDINLADSFDAINGQLVVWDMTELLDFFETKLERTHDDLGDINSTLLNFKDTNHSDLSAFGSANHSDIEGFKSANHSDLNQLHSDLNNLYGDVHYGVLGVLSNDSIYTWTKTTEGLVLTTQICSNQNERAILQKGTLIYNGVYNYLCMSDCVLFCYSSQGALALAGDIVATTTGDQWSHYNSVTDSQLQNCRVYGAYQKL